MAMDEISEYNRQAWDGLVERGNQWTRPVGEEIIAAAKRGDWSVVLTPERPVPRTWFEDIEGLELLALASGGGQQVPVLSAAGAQVTVLDNSPKQLGQDRKVADHHGLPIETVLGDMRDLSC
ncbi:MAG: class I SAM-dependent methyltransferase, partial [Planctomycetota bacterium]